MLKFFSSILCTSRIHPFSLGNYLRASLIIENLMIIRVTSVEWTWLGYMKTKGDYDFG
jgi:fido (protein-threonine AMPylation protein)